MKRRCSVNFSLGLQFHIGADSNGYLRVDPNFFHKANALDLLTNHFAMLSNKNQFALNISELDFDPTVSMQDKIKIIQTIITAARNSHVVKTINFWTALRINDVDSSSLFDLAGDINGEYPKTPVYYAALQAALH